MDWWENLWDFRRRYLRPNLCISAAFSDTLSPGWWFFATPLKNDGVRQLGWLFPIYGKIRHVPNHHFLTFLCAPCSKPPTKYWSCVIVVHHSIGIDWNTNAIDVNLGGYTPLLQRRPIKQRRKVRPFIDYTIFKYQFSYNHWVSDWSLFTLW